MTIEEGRQRHDDSASKLESSVGHGIIRNTCAHAHAHVHHCNEEPLRCENASWVFRGLSLHFLSASKGHQPPCGMEMVGMHGSMLYEVPPRDQHHFSKCLPFYIVPGMGGSQRNKSVSGFLHN